MPPVETTNYEKFQTGNPVVRRLIDSFFRNVGGVIESLDDPTAVLDAGCGEGETLARLVSLLPPEPTGVDLNADSVAFAANRLPHAHISQADIHDLPFADGSFDLVLCLEVLEHIPSPESALSELARVSSSDILISVPHEPWFRLGSLARGKYIKTWGNHPEHINHWNEGSLRSFLNQRVDVISSTKSFPWLLAHCRPRET